MEPFGFLLSNLFFQEVSPSLNHTKNHMMMTVDPFPESLHVSNTAHGKDLDASVLQPKMLLNTLQLFEQYLKF